MRSIARGLSVVISKNKLYTHASMDTVLKH